jgi:hypothetical protein
MISNGDGVADVLGDMVDSNLVQMAKTTLYRRLPSNQTLEPLAGD